VAVDRKVGFAVVGLGSIAQSSVLPAFANSKKAKLMTLVSRDGNKAARPKVQGPVLALNGSIRGLSGQSRRFCGLYRDAPGEHASTTMQAAGAGKHVLCEKPLAALPEQSSRMIEACRKQGVLLMTAYRKYFEPGALPLKQLMQDSTLGRVDVSQTAFNEVYTSSTSISWLVNKQLAGGGPLMDLGVYGVNTARWLVNEDPVEAESRSWHHDPRTFDEVEQGISFTLRFRSGLIVQATASHGAVLSSQLFVAETDVSSRIPHRSRTHLDREDRQKANREKISSSGRVCAGN